MHRSFIGKTPGARPAGRRGTRLSASMAAALAALLLSTGALAQQPALTSPTSPQSPQSPASAQPQIAPQQPAQARAPEVDTEKEAYAKLPPCKLSDDGKHLAEEPCRTAKALDPMPRRPVPQAIERVSPAESDPRDQARPPSAMAPVPNMPATPSRVLPTPLTPPTSSTPSTPSTSSRPDPAARPGALVPSAGCDAAGCNGPNGQRYNNGPGNTVVSPSGKLCTRNGAFIQC